jgi:mRNA interferase HigB
VRLLGRNLLENFKEKHPSSRTALDRWQKIVEETIWKSLADLRKTFPSADFVKGYTVFNVGGNKVRTITIIEYGIAQVLVTGVLSHQEYDRKRWINK